MLVPPGQAKKSGSQKIRRESQRISFEGKCCFRQNVVDQSTIQSWQIDKSISWISGPNNLQRIFVICLHNISLSIFLLTMWRVPRNCISRWNFWRFWQISALDPLSTITLLLISYSSLLNCTQSVVSWKRQTSWSTSSNVSIIE